MIETWSPRRGDVVWADFDPPPPPAKARRVERHPVLVLSQEEYNARSGLALVCPISADFSDYPFDVEIPWGIPIWGTVLSDQVRSIDWRRRRAVPLGTVNEFTVRRVTLNVARLLDLRG